MLSKIAGGRVVPKERLNIGWGGCLVHMNVGLCGGDVTNQLGDA